MTILFNNFYPELPPKIIIKLLIVALVWPKRNSGLLEFSKVKIRHFLLSKLNYQTSLNIFLLLHPPYIISESLHNEREWPILPSKG